MTASLPWGTVTVVNWKEFISEVLGAVAWPTAFVAVALIFRTEVKALIGRVKYGEAFGAKLTFGDGINEVESARAEADVGGMQSASVVSETRLYNLARDLADHPSLLVVTAWEEVQAPIWELGRAYFPRFGPGSDRASGPIRTNDDVVRELGREIVLPFWVRQYERLRDLRDSVAHGRVSPTEGEASAYVVNAAWLIRSAQALAESAPG